MVIPGIYCLVDRVFLDVKEPPSMPRIPQFLILTLTALFLSITLPPQARAQQPDDVVWVQIQAVQSLATATDRAQAYTALLEDVNGFALGGGWYGIVVGPYTRADAELVLQTYRRDGLIPRDSFLQSTPRLGQQFWPVGANVLNRGVIEAPETIETPPPAAPETPTPQAPEVAEVVPEPEPEPADETPAEARRSERALDRDARKELQVALKWAGFYAGAIDGAYGRGTRGSMGQWQEANGYERTGVLTTLQRADLLRQYNSVLDGLGLRLVTDQRAGIEMILPMNEVALSVYEPPFVQYNSSGDIGARVLLISQAGDQSTMFGLYEIMQTLEIVPLDGPRNRNRQGFELVGQNADFISETSVIFRNGRIKGFTLIWPTGDEERRTRVLEQMRASFTALPGVLDAADATAAQSIDLISGLEIRKPRLSRSGFFVDGAGTVVTTSEAVGSCGRITLDSSADADVIANDPATGLALLKPQTALAPLAIASFATAEPRLQSEVTVAGYSYEGVLSAASLSFGKVADIKGLRGETGINRLDLTAQPGDVGGPVFDASGAVVGMLLPKPTSGPQLPEGTAFTIEAAMIAQIATEAGLTLQGADGLGQMPPRALTRQAQDMTVLVSCWD
jgi:S1-C subfamily serine protease